MRGTAAVLIIGDEVLSGKIRDENGPYFIQELRDLGFPLRHLETIGDSVPEIAASVRRLSEAHEVVFTSGGVGPTLDDLTFQGVAAAFDLPLKEHLELAEVIRAHFEERVNASHLRMAQIPEGAALEWSPGISWPLITLRNVVILPGYPPVLREKFEAVKERWRRDPITLRKLLFTLEEGELAPLLDEVAAAHPGVKLGSYPRYGEACEVTITFDGLDPDEVEAALGELTRLVRRRDGG